VTGAAEGWRVAWDVPGGAFALHVDALSALFLLPVFVLGALGVIYGRAYWEHPGAPQPRAAWAWHHLFVGSMALVVLAANAVLFLVAWEAMSVVAFFLVPTRMATRPCGRRAGPS
jgi:hydrogenase-4 component B